MKKKRNYPKTRDVAKRKGLVKALKTVPKIKKKRLKDVMDEVDGKSGLTMKQEIFCRCYATTREFFGNGVQSYIEAYKPDMSKKGWYNVARYMASTMLTNPNIMRRINDLLSNEGWNHGNMDKQLNFVASQYSDLKSKVMAIREYNRVTKRVDDAPKIPVSFEIVINVPKEPKEDLIPTTPNEPDPSDGAGDSAGESPDQF